MNTELLKARLNLHVVLRNLEDLPALDAQTADRIREWDIALHFAVRGGPEAGLVFEGGQCRHYAGRPPRADVKLFFFSPAHLNAMFAGTGNPIPLKGFSKLGFLKNDFTALTQRLEHFLRPDAEKLKDPDYLRANSLLTLYTGVFAVKHLAELDPVAAKVAAATPPGTVQFVVDGEPPLAHLTYNGAAIEPGKSAVERPSAIMWLADWAVANQVVNGQVDSFAAIGKGLVRLDGVVPIIDNTGLIMDRVARYLA